jgi:hypothetical protein
MFLRKRRVRLHLVASDADLPSVEGILERRGREYLVSVPELLVAAGGNPQRLEARLLAIPREKIAFYEVL